MHKSFRSRKYTFINSSFLNNRDRLKKNYLRKRTRELGSKDRGYSAHHQEMLHYIKTYQCKIRTVLADFVHDVRDGIVAQLGVFLELVEKCEDLNTLAELKKDVDIFKENAKRQ